RYVAQQRDGRFCRAARWDADPDRQVPAGVRHRTARRCGVTGTPHLCIGEVLSVPQGEYPDVTHSKIRFLESQGLIQPERTSAGYRKFYEKDIERLRWVLHQQRDHFLPLKVIRKMLEEGVDRYDPSRGAQPTLFTPMSDEGGAS